MSEWISTKRRFPKSEQSVLIVFGYNPTITTGFIRTGLIGCPVAWFSSWDHSEIKTPVHYWMPLPELPTSAPSSEASPDTPASAPR